MILFTSICIAVGIVVLFVGRRHGPHVALGISSLLTLLCPVWVYLEAFGREINLKVAGGIVALGLYCLHPKAVFRARLIALDYLMIGFVLVIFIADVSNSGFDLGILAQIYGEWFVAYVLGRLSLSNFENIRQLALPAAMIVSAIAILGIYESLSGVNVLESLLDNPSTDNVYYPERYGFRRATGPTENPIYFGVLLFLLLPWLIQFAIQKKEDSLQPGWLFLIVPGIIGVFSTLSRAPIFSLAAYLAIPAFIFFPATRKPFLSIGLLGGILMFFFQAQIIEMLQQVGQEYRPSSQQTILLDGKMTKATSTTIRMQLWEFYRPAIRQAGLFGYGSHRTSVFPPNVPMGGNNDIKTLKALFAIDNQFLLFILRFGYLGLMCWLAGLALAVWNFGHLAVVCPIDVKWFCAASASALAGVFFIQVTVWMPQDYGFYLIWMMGSSSGLYSAYLKKSDSKSHQYADRRS